MKVDEVLDFFHFQFNETFKCTYMFSNFKFYNHDISNFQCKEWFEHNLANQY